MKRGKDEDKIMGPMFPRLHVNDTEKGGPRAPPRNKMALYEQLSIPSQRFNSGISTLNPNNTAKLIPPASSSLGIAQERGTLFPLQQPPPSREGGNSRNRSSDLNSQQVPLEQNKRLEEDDFRVPIFVQSGIGQDRNIINRANRSSLGPAYPSAALKNQGENNKEPKRTSTIGLNLRRERTNLNKENSRELESGREKSVNSASNLLSREKMKGQKRANTSIHDRDDDSRDMNFNMSNNSIKGGVVANGDSSVQLRYEQAEEQRNHDDPIPINDTDDPIPINDTESHQDETFRSLQTGKLERGGDDVSETSMVDSISDLDISPDDVVGIIGQKHFWKARRAIVNQQRVFAVQVFELHRLIKVQRLFAGSPNILVEDNAFLGKPLKSSSAKKLPLDLEFIVKAPTTTNTKHKDDSRKPTNKMEGSAENAVGRTSVSSVQNGPFSGNLSQSADPKTGPWCYHQPPGHQWLIPVMSPSEGLVYKPYPGPEFSNQICGCSGQPGPNPMMGNFLSPSYGVPGPYHQYQGMGIPPFTPPPSHGYFPPYGMPVMNPSYSGSVTEQMNHFARPGPNPQLSGGGADFNTRSHNGPGPKNGTKVVRSSKESELQFSTASSPSEKAQATVVGRSALPLFPTSPIVNASTDGGPAQTPEAEQPTRVIRVVPRNARNATVFAARIFQSIQEERKQYDSV